MADATAVVLLPGAGRRITGGSLDAAVKITTDHPALTSAFEVVIGPGFDVAAHVHAHGEELFYVVEGELDVLAFEPLDRAVPDWHHWQSGTGERFLRGGPGAFMFVPPGVPHAFSNPTGKPVKVFFQSSVPGGHENYFRRTHGAAPAYVRPARSGRGCRSASPVRHRAHHRTPLASGFRMAAHRNWPPGRKAMRATVRKERPTLASKDAG